MESAFTKKRAVVYARANAFERYSIHSQVRLCHAKMKNDQVEEVYPPIVDIASGKSHKRYGLRELQKLAENRSIDYLYVCTIDRLGREIVKTLQLLKILAEADVTVKTVDGEFSFSNLGNIGSV